MSVLYAVSGLLVWRLPSQRPIESIARQRNPAAELLGQLKEGLRLLMADRAMLVDRDNIRIVADLGLSADTDRGSRQQGGSLRGMFG